MAKLSVTDPHTVAGVVSELGGRVIDGPTFRFESAATEVREVVPKLNQLGLRCERVDARVGDHPDKLTDSAAT